MDTVVVTRESAPIKKIETIYEPTNRPEITVSPDTGWPPIKFQYHARYKGAKSWWTPDEAREFAKVLTELANQVPQTNVNDCYSEDE